MNTRKWRAFTLIEILAVVAIIGILSGLSYGPIKAARVRSRDIKRKADVNAIAQSLDLYYAEKRTYPGTVTPCTVYRSNNVTDWNTFTNLIKTYVPVSSSVPIDPINNTSYRYTYQYCATDGKFTITSALENPNDLDGTLIDPNNASAGKKYEINR